LDIQHNILSDEEMALSLLSQDDSFDICSMHSRQEISENIKNKGSFYPLNDVDGVKEYLDACFPYIKEAATNSDGDIWMLPISVDIPCLFYNENVCTENGIDFERSMEPDDYFNLLTKLHEYDALMNLCYYGNLIDDFFYQYLRSYKDFNSDEIRNIAKIYKTKLNFTIETMLGNVLLPANLSAENDANFLFMYISDQLYQIGVADNQVLRASKLPSFTDNTKNVATCYYLTVNPASKNLKEALRYISSLCKYISSKKNIILSKDRNAYPDTQVMDDLFEIYSNGDIQFTYPNELFLDDFMKYLKGEKDLEDMINDSNRRLNTYLYE
jgi:ABC-type glycerol-3-phosphate transport system substrate-binding protein